ncbi:hypothetical protein BV22DRAFT_1197150 [Leucogyrophana mollusca]|uniref:Uncharacterized protein n=1 Tax=Leucogyrophana mollusca TaxID=85980 RepID=A0ACB8BDQ4_9AGAM|nr:hypothetical protein BV22DRAFT_1197150 [Leucogyrophana mollusca]
MMEVDMHSPSLRSPRSSSYAMKRPRSPGSPSQERQSKRLSLAIEDPRSYRVIQTPFLNAATHGDGGRQSGSEDWVRQAQDLSIDSPLIPDGPSLHLHDSEQHGMDEIMSLDSEETIPTWKSRFQTHSPPSRHSQPLRTHAPLIQITTTPPVQAIPLQGQHQRQSSAFLPVPSTASPSSPLPLPPPPPSSHSQPLIQNHPPAIFLHPATPSDISPHQNAVPFSLGDQTTQPQSPSIPPGSPMSGTSQGASSPTCPFGTTRKQRFTMGPRADCLKCKMGVKGHWMHLD